MPKIDIVNAKNIIESNPEKAFFKLKNTGGPKGDTGAQGPQGPKGDQGEPGAPGASASVTVGSTITLSPGADATVTNSGDTRNAILNFGIPTGAQGPQGIQGPKGDTGPMGQTGAKGDTGAAATVQVGNTNTGAPGTNAQVTNAGNEHFAVFNFTIPRGDKGETGSTGAQGPKGDTGEQGPQGIQGPKGDTGSVKSDVVAELPETGEEDTFYLVNREATEQTATGKTISFENSDNAGDITDFKLDGETSQNGTPTPDAPVPVSTVTGENTVKICGKNLYEWNDTEWSSPATTAAWCFQDGSSTAGGGAYGPNITDRTPYKITLPAGTYKATVYNISSNIVNIQACKNGTSSEIIITSPTNMNSSNPTSTITLTEQTTLCFRYRVTNPSLGIGDTKIQIEKGSTATTYEPYQGQSYEVNLGNIELCKIGTYQDYIYKSGDKWYVHKETGKYVYNNDLGENGIGSTYVAMLTPTLPTLPNMEFTDGRFWCNSYTPVMQNNTGLQGTNAASRIRVSTSLNIANSYASVRALAAANNLTIYYPLATPTDTEITNEALIAQLDNVASAPLYTGVNNITTITPNEQGTLEIKYVTYDKYNQNKVYIWNDTLQQWQIIVQ